MFCTESLGRCAKKVLCHKDERVRSHQCLPCNDGYFRPGEGDDPAGHDTECHVLFAPNNHTELQAAVFGCVGSCDEDLQIETDESGASYSICNHLSGNWTTSVGRRCRNADKKIPSGQGLGTYGSAIGRWEISNVSSLAGMFHYAHVFNGDISRWDTSQAANMFAMFEVAQGFDGDVGEWDTSSVTTMKNMFFDASSFGGDVHNWDVSSVTNMISMFKQAIRFNSPVNQWDVSRVLGANQFQYMFRGALRFNQAICSSAWNAVKRHIEEEKRRLEEAGKQSEIGIFLLSQGGEFMCCDKGTFFEPAKRRCLACPGGQFQALDDVQPHPASRANQASLPQTQSPHARRVLQESTKTTRVYSDASCVLADGIPRASTAQRPVKDARAASFKKTLQSQSACFVRLALCKPFRASSFALPAFQAHSRAGGGNPYARIARPAR